MSQVRRAFDGQSGALSAVCAGNAYLALKQERSGGGIQKIIDLPGVVMNNPKRDHGDLDWRGRMR